MSALHAAVSILSIDELCHYSVIYCNKHFPRIAPMMPPKLPYSWHCEWFRGHPFFCFSAMIRFSSTSRFTAIIGTKIGQHSALDRSNTFDNSIVRFLSDALCAAQIIRVKYIRSIAARSWVELERGSKNQGEHTALSYQLHACFAQSIGSFAPSRLILHQHFELYYYVVTL